MRERERVLSFDIGHARSTVIVGFFRRGAAGKFVKIERVCLVFVEHVYCITHLNDDAHERDVLPVQARPFEGLLRIVRTDVFLERGTIRL